jgi:hypothetical protein
MSAIFVKDEEHQDQLDADQHHADAHPGFQRDRHGRKRLSLQAGESGPGIGVRVDPDAEPRHAVTAQNADDAEDDDDDDLDGREVEQEPEVDHHDRRDEGPEDGEELPLGDEVGLAGLPDQL